MCISLSPHQLVQLPHHVQLPLPSPQVNVAPRYVEAGSLALLRTVLQHEVMHVLGFDPNAFELFRDETSRLRERVTVPAWDAVRTRVLHLTPKPSSSV